MLKRDVREMVEYLISERKSFKVTFANGKVEVVEYRGYCWVLGNKGYSDKDLVKKMVRFQDNVSKFIIRLEVIEEVEEVEEVEELEEVEEMNYEESLIEEVENLNDDLFQEEDLVYCEEAIKRETNIELRIDVDIEVIEETGYSVEEIEKVVMSVSFTNFRINEWTIVTLDNKEQIKLLPWFTSFNTFVISVSYY